MRLLYMCQWDTNKEKTWSGTTYSLYKSLEKRFESVKDIDMKLNKFEKALMLLLGLNKYVFNRKSFSENFSSIGEYIYKYKMKNKTINNDSVILQIGDFMKCNNMYYIYQDLSIDSLLYFKEYNNELFNYSNFQNITRKDMEKRRDRQLEIYSKSNGIFTMSKWLANNLIKYSNIPEEKVHWVGGGININPNNIKNLDRNNKRILFVGRDFIRKGGDITYEAFKILKEKYLQDAELYVAGPKEWPMDDRIEGVTFLGDLSSEELSYYFNLCDIFCMPSRFEAYGLVFIEALAYGLPCIGRNEFEMKEFICNGYNGYLVEDDNVDVLAKYMYDLLNNSEIKENILRNREIYIKNYSWDTVAERIIEVINKDSKKNNN